MSSSEFHPDIFVQALREHLKKIIVSENLEPNLKCKIIQIQEGNIRSWEERIKAELEGKI